MEKQGGKDKNIRPNSAWPDMRRSRGKRGFCTRAPGSSLADALTLASGFQDCEATYFCAKLPGLRVVAALGRAHRIYWMISPVLCRIFLRNYCFETGSCHIAQAGLNLLILLSAGFTGLGYRVWPVYLFFFF